jgi:hypothetical protein
MRRQSWRIGPRGARNFHCAFPLHVALADESNMAQREDIPDAELIQRFAEGDEAAFDTIFRRYDADFVCVIEHQLRNVTDREHHAREIADLLWLDLKNHPDRLSQHDPSRRALSSFLKLLAWRAARRFLGKLTKKDKLLGNKAENVADLFDEFERLADQWRDVAQLLPAETLAKALRILRRDEPSKTEQRWMERLIQRLRNQLNVS